MFEFDNLDITTRNHMVEELEIDLERGDLYLPHRVKQEEHDAYINMLRSSLTIDSPETFANDIQLGNILNSHENRRSKTGKIFLVRVPRTAKQTLSEGEFNRYYIRAICKRALEEGIDELESYRAKSVGSPRASSTRLVGTTINSKTLLEDLRSNIGIDTALGVPAGPNSGLSVRIQSANNVAII